MGLVVDSRLNFLQRRNAHHYLAAIAAAHVKDVVPSTNFRQAVENGCQVHRGLPDEGFRACVMVRRVAVPQLEDYVVASWVFGTEKDRYAPAMGPHWTRRSRDNLCTCKLVANLRQNVMYTYMY